MKEKKELEEKEKAREVKKKDKTDMLIHTGTYMGKNLEKKKRRKRRMEEDADGTKTNICEE